ncbi:MAG: site-2 protease family protein [bacterium]|nr:site-2 protease family protein [bacterium]
MVILPILLFSVVFHEYAHGIIAEKCGDDTARVMGRITLNPLKHIDLVGTIILPALLIFSGAKFLFAWAKPVPINPRKFQNYKLDIMKVAAAGPLANLTLVFFTLFILFLLRIINFNDQALLGICHYAVYINVVLMLFNLLPIVPLDGSKILYGVASQGVRNVMDKLEPFGFIILLVLINIPIFRRIFFGLVVLISETLLGII